MPTTAQDLITRALRRSKCIGRDQVASAEDGADGLVALNALLDLWWNERLLVFHLLQENFPLVAGQASRTIGVGGNFNTTWPVKIVGARVRRNGQDFPVSVLEDRKLYDDILDKSIQGLTYALFYDRAYPLGTIYFYYVPDQADTLYLNSYARLQSLAALVTPVSLPPGYEQLIVDGLAIDRAPEYGREAPAAVVRGFARAMRVLKRMNTSPPVMQLDPVMISRSLAGGYSITTDE